MQGQDSSPTLLRELTSSLCHLKMLRNDILHSLTFPPFIMHPTHAHGMEIIKDPDNFNLGWSCSWIALFDFPCPYSQICLLGRARLSESHPWLRRNRTPFPHLEHSSSCAQKKGCLVHRLLESLKKALHPWAFIQLPKLPSYPFRSESVFIFKANSPPTLEGWLDR